MGTWLGGIFSSIAYLFFLVFVLVQLYAWFFTPTFSQSFEVEYISREDRTVYEIPTTLMIPVGAILDVETMTLNSDDFDAGFI